MAEKKQSATWKVAKKIGKLLGWSLPEWIPGIGWLWPGNIILVYRVMQGDLMGPEGMLMMVIAGTCYLVTFCIGIIEFFLTLGLFSTLITWTIGAIFAAWAWKKGREQQTDAPPEDADANILKAPKETPKTPRESGKNQMAA